MNHKIHVLSQHTATWWEATNNLRYHQPKLTQEQIESGRVPIPPRLQQMWQSNDGQTEWRYIEVEVE
jgi:hypothetical protein